MDYLAIKHLHMTCAALSGSLFLLRAGWMWRDSALLQQRWVRLAPHVIDTALLGSAVMLAYLSGQTPWGQAWLGAKLGALLLYIVLGTLALKRGKTKAVRRTASVLALLVFLYIGAVAISKQPLIFA